MVLTFLGLPGSGHASAARSTTPSPIRTWTGDQPGERYGWAVSVLRDVNLDGTADAIIGAPFHATAAGANAGHVDVRSARSGTIVQSYIGRPGELLGYAIADAGDVDGDGVHDVVIGAPQGGLSCTGSEVGPGHAYVRSGTTGALLLTLGGAPARAHLGAAASAAGDINRDGHADLLVGAPCAGPGGAQSGAAYVYSGADGTVLRTYAGEAAGNHFGIGTAPVGDIDHDRITDVAIAATDAGQGRRGVVSVYSGRTGKRRLRLSGGPESVDLGWFFVAGVGDVDRDGTPDIFAGDFDAGANNGNARGAAFVFSGATGKKLDVFRGASPNAGTGPGRGAGDVNHDGVPDIVVGSYTSSDGAPLAGRVDVYSGRTGRPIRTYISSISGENLGFDAVGIGDVNCDGHPDLLVSAASGDTVYVLSAA
jgi:FG-GAP repeat/FG-GAP-like repeat